MTPCIKKYLDNFASGFDNNLEGVKVAFMQSDGGLTPMNSFNGSRAILSGPAGGVVGYAVTTTAEQVTKLLLTIHLTSLAIVFKVRTYSIGFKAKRERGQSPSLLVHFGQSSRWQRVR